MILENFVQYHAIRDIPPDGRYPVRLIASARFQEKRRPALHEKGETGEDEPAYAKSVRAAVHSRARLVVSDLGFESLDRRCRYIGRVRYNHVDRGRGYGRCFGRVAALDEFHAIAHAVQPRVVFGDVDGVAGRVREPLSRISNTTKWVEEKMI